ncbi:hypothetical protein FRACYDRAFT_244250 [Fragilariopsis cylindrus CCMP1102]|uniref:Uncharacterized protein n=1 Tax=Fragilariopsis cylindrus CCMP1102 TaxID=635003 RepID=A0A1E7F1J4_9STRA|nr:hypothetical protein FRACYDRAFT_244250 [Fragilariopsis cylindrus CCMP1102]|eukprot:OEU12060.1 hypothetical protein FRACYDRAFT_244250 [Fragilariopsis cylindrus CCMP1102]
MMMAEEVQQEEEEEEQQPSKSKCYTSSIMNPLDDDHQCQRRCSPLPTGPRLPTIQESEHLIASSSSGNTNNTSSSCTSSSSSSSNNNTSDFHRVVESFNYNVIDDDDADDCDSYCDNIQW